MSSVGLLPPFATPLTARGTRAFFAPVNRVTGTPTLYDPAVSSYWPQGVPPAPWVDLGWVTGFTRIAESKISEIDTGSPATVHVQTRSKVSASVALEFATWTKLTMALATGSQHMNLLTPATSRGPAIGSGAKAAKATVLGGGSTAYTLYVPGAVAAGMQAGSAVVVDDDYVAQVGFVGAGVSAAYMRSGGSTGSDADSIRRVSFNVGRIASIGGDGGLQLAAPLPAGPPTSSMKIQSLVGFVDREGGSFFQEWSALFVMTGTEGDRLCFHYPRLQACQSAEESLLPVAALLDIVKPTARFRALPVTDGNDGEQVICYRSYLPCSFNPL